MIPQKKRRWPGRVVSFFFFALLWLPVIDCFTGLDVARPPDENRLPAPRPQWAGWNFSGAQQFMAQAEAYFNDHFGFRKRLIRLSHQWKSGLFRDESGHKVVIGPHGWLFTGELQMIDHFLGLEHFTPAQLEAWRKLLEKRRDWLAARGIKYLFVVAPDKQDIYPEELPAWLLAAAPAQRETKLDQFLKYMKAHSTVVIADLRPALLAAKPLAPLYLRNDGHWNLLGGFIGGQQVIAAVQRQLPELPPLKLEDFAWTNLPAFGGDMARFLGQQELAEKNFFQLTPKTGLPAVVERGPANVSTAWNPRAFFSLSENPAAPDVRAIFFHDSFALPWKSPFAYCFRWVYFMAERRAFDARIVEENHPHIVVNEMLERYFNTLVPEEMMAADALP